MSWKDIVKAPPFDIQHRSKVYQKNDRGETKRFGFDLEKKLKHYLDAPLNATLRKYPFSWRFDVFISLDKYQELVRLAGSNEQLQNAIESLYNVKHVFFFDYDKDGLSLDGKIRFEFRKK
jgi:hypothetical protein